MWTNPAGTIRNSARVVGTVTAGQDTLSRAISFPEFSRQADPPVIPPGRNVRDTEPEARPCSPPGSSLLYRNCHAYGEPGAPQRAICIILRTKWANVTSDPTQFV